MDEQRAADVFCSRWPKKNRRELDEATHDEKVSLVSQLDSVEKKKQKTTTTERLPVGNGRIVGHGNI